jgi:hypothetical protein
MFARVDDASRGTGVNCSLSTAQGVEGDARTDIVAGEVVSAVCVETIVAPMVSLPTIISGGKNNPAPGDGSWGGNWTSGQWGVEGKVVTTTVTYAASQIRWDKLVLITAPANGTNSGTVGGGVATMTTFTTTTAGGSLTGAAAGKLLPLWKVVVYMIWWLTLL